MRNLAALFAASMLSGCYDSTVVPPPDKWRPAFCVERYKLQEAYEELWTKREPRKHEQYEYEQAKQWTDRWCK